MAKLNKQGLDKAKLSAKKEDHNWIKVGLSTCGIAAGADVVFNTLLEESKKRNIDIDVRRCGCQGMCYAEPLIEVHVKGLPDVIYGKVDREGAIKILDKHVCGNILVKDHIYELKTKR